MILLRCCFPTLLLLQLTLTNAFLRAPTASFQERNLEGIGSPFNLYQCVARCAGTEFCGRDLECHVFSCNAWYTLGPSFFTGYTPNVSEDLICEDMMDEDRSFLSASTVCDVGLPLAVEYLAPNTSGYACEDRNRPGQLASVALNRKCTAQPRNKTGFVCYDLSPFTDMQTHFGKYLATTENNDGTVGHHRYPLQIQGFDPESKASLTRLMGRGGGGSNSSLEFNTTEVQASMQSLLFETPEKTDAFPYCAGGCKIGEFCGVDGACHEIDCETMYEYGPLSMTGRDADDNDESTALKCTMELQDQTSADHLNPCHDNTQEQWPLAVEYQCMPFGTGRVSFQFCAKKELDGRYLTFARMCTAKPNADQDFACFDMKGPNLTEYTAEYVNRTETDGGCTVENLDPYLQSTHSDWVTCDSHDSWDNPQCLEPEHKQTHRNRNATYGTSAHLRDASQNALDEPLSLDVLEHAIYSRLIGTRSVEEESEDSVDSSEDNVDSSAASRCQQQQFGSLLFALIGAASALMVE